MKIDIYSDGSGQTSSTDGGYGWVMVIDGVKHSEGSGRVPNATNNDMELEAAIQGLTAIYNLLLNEDSDIKSFAIKSPEPTTQVTLVSDSEIVLGWASGTYRFKQESKIVKYNQLRYLMDKLNAKTRWVKGHSGDIYNTRCDRLANNARKGISDKVSPNPNSVETSRIGTKKEGVFCVWYGDKLKIICLTNNVVEDYNREIHGKRGSLIEIRQEKMR